MTVIRWLGRRKIEIALFLLGVALRLTMKWNHHFAWTYDGEEHWVVVQWILAHERVPRAESTFESFHPPLYYGVAAWLVSHGVTRAGLAWLSIACGILRLAIVWAGLELYLPTSRWARVFGLALAATIATAVQVDGMLYPEPISNLLNALALLLVPLAFRRAGVFRLPFTIAIGLVLGLAMLTKISAFMTIAAIGTTALIELAFGRKPLRARCTDAWPWAASMAVVLGVSGWYYARNVQEYGRPFVTSFALRSQRWVVEGIEKQTLVLDRRSLGFFVGWSSAIHARPHRPAALKTRARYFPAVVASSVVDYWPYNFAGFEDPRPGELTRPVRSEEEVEGAARRAVAGGALAFFAIVAAWLVSFAKVVQRRDSGRLALLLAPFYMLLGALYFATVAPVDDYGVLKGSYLTFAAPPLYGLFGVAMAWAMRRPTRWGLFVLLLVSLAFIAAYTIVCRFGL